MDPLLDLFLGLFGGLEPQDLFTGPEESLGTQVWVYNASGNRIELTNPANQFDDLFDDIDTRVGAGFGNPANKYSWSSALYDDGGGEDLYIGTFNAFVDYRGLVTAFIKISQQSKVGAGLDLSNPSGFFSALTDNEFFPTLIDTQGGEIWKYESLTPGDPGAAGGTWSKVYDAAEVPKLGPDVAGFRSMTSFDGKLLAASSSSLIFDLLSINQDQVTTISVYDGSGSDSGWSVLTGGPFDDPNNASIRTMKEVGGKLVIGTENAKEGAEIWTLEFNGNTPIWDKLPSPVITYESNTEILTIGASIDALLEATASGLYGSTSFAASTGDIVDLNAIFESDALHSSLSEFENKFLIGTWQPFGLFLGDVSKPDAALIQIISPANLLAWGEGSFNVDIPDTSGNESLLPFGQGGTDNGVMRMEIYNGYLYVGSVNYTGGTTVVRIALSTLNARLAWEIPFDSGKGATGGWQVLTTDGFRSLSSDLAPLDPNIGTVVQLDGSGNPLTNAVTDQVKGDGGDGISVYSWSMKVVNDKLYIGDFSGEAGTARLYEIDDQNTEVKIKIVEDVFGAEAYGLRTMQAYTPIWVTPTSQDVQQTPTNLIIGDADPFDSEIGLLNRFIDDPTRQVKLIVGDKSGGENDDVLFGAGLRVKIQGLGGEDIIIGTRFADHLDGGADQDLMIGNLGADKMYGGDQSDLMWGDLPSFGSNSIAEGLALQLRALLLQAMSPEMIQVWMQADPSVESLMAMLSDLGPNIPGAQDALWVLSQIGADSAMWGEELLPSLAALGDAGLNLRLSSFNDMMYGCAGEDIMFGGLGDDKMYGGDNDDIIIGQQGADSLWGDSGDDQLEGGRGRDYYYGGLGNDIYDLRIQAMDSSGNMIMQTDGEKDTIVYARGDFETTAPRLAEETVFGFEQGIDKVDIDKRRMKVSILDNVATLTYKGSRRDTLNGSMIKLSNDDVDFNWEYTDFI